MEYLVLLLIGLVLLGGLVALGVGHARWNWGTLAAAFLVLLTAGGFLYLAGRLAQRERAWAARVDDYQARLARAVDGAGPAPEGGSLDELAAYRDRLRQAYEVASAWRGRTWQEASFRPPRDADSTGEIELAPDGNIADRPPLRAGAIVYVFDDAAFEDGGRYLGQFVVRETSYEQRPGRHVLTVALTGPPDAYDTGVLVGDHDPVTVCEELPVASTEVPPGEWATAIEQVREGQAPAAAYGALVRFTEPFSVAVAEGTAAQEFNPGDVVELDLARALKFADPGGGAAADPGGGPAVESDGPTRAVIERIVARRPLLDYATLLHGGRVATTDGATVAAGGLTAQRDAIEGRIRSLARANTRLESAIQDTESALAATQKTAGELTEDLTTWGRDVEASEQLAGRFDEERRRTTDSLEATEGEIVALGRELTRALASLAAEIDRISPPPGQ
jgi:hypothetical protein